MNTTFDIFILIIKTMKRFFYLQLLNEQVELAWNFFHFYLENWILQADYNLKGFKTVPLKVRLHRADACKLLPLIKLHNYVSFH